MRLEHHLVGGYVRYISPHIIIIIIINLCQDNEEVWRCSSLKININESSHNKLTIKPCLCCVQLHVSFHCYGHVFFSVILLQFN